MRMINLSSRLFVSIFFLMGFADLVVGDTLTVNSRFPSIAFKNAADDGDHMTTLQEVQRDTALVFVFASW